MNFCTAGKGAGYGAPGGQGPGAERDRPVSPHLTLPHLTSRPHQARAEGSLFPAPPPPRPLSGVPPRTRWPSGGAADTAEAESRRLLPHRRHDRRLLRALPRRAPPARRSSPPRGGAVSRPCPPLLVGPGREGGAGRARRRRLNGCPHACREAGAPQRSRPRRWRLGGRGCAEEKSSPAALLTRACGGRKSSERPSSRPAPEPRRGAICQPGTA